MCPPFVAASVGRIDYSAGVELARALALIDQQITDAKDGYPENFSEWRNKTEVVVRTIFGELSPNHRKFTDVRYTPQVSLGHGYEWI